MLNKMQLAILKKDFKSVTINKRLFSALLIVPLMFSVFIPSVFIVSIALSPANSEDFKQILQLLPSIEIQDDPRRMMISMVLNHILPVFFIIIPVMAASVMAASAFVGEKEKHTLETLLYTPLSLKKIFQAKVMAAFSLSILVTFGAFVLMLVVVETELYFILGHLFLPGITWLLTILLVAPAISLIAVTLIVGGSAKAQTVEESQQRAVFLILPVIVLVVGQFTGLLLISSWVLLVFGVVCAGISALLLKNSLRKFSYEQLLR